MGRKIVFPPVHKASDDGLVAVGGDLEIDTLIEAYHHGIFPWPVSTFPLNIDLPHTWFSPDPRGLLEFKNIHVSRSFVKFLKKTPYIVTFNKAFPDVITMCAKTPRKDQPGTWITPEIINAYINLFTNDYAYSVEVWDGKRLVGGLYGVIMGTFVSGESMFTLEDNASKQGFYSLLMHLQKKGIGWIDTQMVTEVVKQFGGKYYPRPIFLKHLEKVDWTKRKSEIF
jgi:leucyl/phenylalanyl-tRNA---protein transferase